MIDLDVKYHMKYKIRFGSIHMMIRCTDLRLISLSKRHRGALGNENHHIQFITLSEANTLL